MSEAQASILTVIRANPGIRTGDAAKRAGLQFKHGAHAVFTLRSDGFVQPSDPARYGECWPVEKP